MPLIRTITEGPSCKGARCVTGNHMTDNIRSERSNRSLSASCFVFMHVAQLEERRSPKPQVGGSRPPVHVRSYAEVVKVVLMPV